MSLTQVLSNYLSELITKHANGKKQIKVEDLLVALKSDEVQTELTQVIKKAMPKPKRERVVKLKDPEAPKRFKTAYMFFCESFRAKNPAKKGKDVLRDAGAEWKSLSEAKKKPFVAKAKTDRERYDEAMKEYERPSDEDLAKLDINNKKQRKPRKVKDGKPKRARTAYAYFVGDKAVREQIKADNPDVEPKGMLSLVAQAWKELPEEDKQKYIDLALADKERSATERAEWKEAHGEEDSAPKARGRPKGSKNKSKSEDEKGKEKEKKVSKRVIEKVDEGDESVQDQGPVGR